jgi:ribonuclease R
VKRRRSHDRHDTPAQHAKGSSRRGGEAPQKRPPAAEGLDEARVLEVLAAQQGSSTATTLAEAMGISGPAIKDVSAALRRLEDTGQAMQLRPGKWVAAGTGGEYPVRVEERDGRLVAVFVDGVVRDIPVLHRMGARAGDEAFAAIDRNEQAMLTRITGREGRETVGVLTFHFGRPVLVTDRRREGELPVLGDDGQVLDRYTAGARIVARVVTDAGLTGVRLLRILDESSPEVADFTQVVLSHDLPMEFPAEVLALAEAVDPHMSPEGREDLREQFIFTIDPDTAKDFDDAISLESLGGRGWRVGVHIADVSHYVAEGSPIDLEAIRRGTSCYLVNRVIPMLPERLSNGLCSLVPHQDRYALSLFIDLDRDRKVTAVRAAETIINSRHRLTYEQALEVIKGKDHEDEQLTALLRQCARLTQDIRRDRERAGALNLFSVEHRFSLDVEGNPVEVTGESSDPAHQLIEELMLLANRCVATWLDEHESTVVYRLHGEPDEARLEVFNAALETYGITGIPIQSREGQAAVLRRLEREPPAARLVLNSLLLRCFQKAYYGTEPLGHYALAFSHYAHFTSPIRRYPDLLVHRAVKRVLGLKAYRAVQSEPEVLEALAKRSSFLERRAEDAERQLHAIKACRYLTRRIGDSFAGVVLGASNAGLFIHMLEIGLEALLPIRELDDDFYQLDRERMALVGANTGRVLGVGTELMVQVINVDVSRCETTLGLDGKPRPGRAHRQP